MKKRNKDKGLQSSATQNPVAKFAYRFNKSQVFIAKCQYRRNAKHRGLEPFAIISGELMAKGLAV